MTRVCVFCGSRDGASPAHRAAATATGQALAARGLDLVYGGSASGLMGAVADAVLEGGRAAIGVIPVRLAARQEFAHPRLTEVHHTASMAERKHLMFEKADAFLTLPGGFGTLDELFEALTATQLGLHRKPVGLLDVDGYFAPLLTWIERGLRDGFVPPHLAGALVVERDPHALVERLLRAGR